MTIPFPYFSEADLSDLKISTPGIIDAIEGAIHGREGGTVWSTPKSAFPLPDGRYMMSTFAAMSEPSLVVTKSVVLPSGIRNGGELRSTRLYLCWMAKQAPVAMVSEREWTVPDEGVS